MKVNLVMDVALATAGDVDRCLEIRTAAFRNQAPSCYSEDQVKSLLARDETPRMLEMIANEQMFVANLDSVLVGCGGWWNVNVYNLYVHPNVMRRGVGSALVSAIEAQFTAKTTESTLHIDAGLYTEPFYVSCGYSVIRRVVSSDDLAYLEMQKPLRPDSSG